LKEILEPVYGDTDSYIDEGETPDTQLATREDIPTGEGLLSKDSKFSEMVPKGIIGKSPESDALDDDDQISKFESSKSSDKGKSSISDLKADLRKIMDRVPTKRLVKKPQKKVDKESEKKFEREFEDLLHDEETEEKKLEPESEPESELGSELGSEPEKEPEPELDKEYEKSIRRRKRRTADEDEEPKIEYRDPALDLEGEIEDQATTLMKTLEGRIEKSKELGFNIPMAERLFSIAESYFENGEFERVLEYTKKGIKNVTDMAARKGFTTEIGLEIVGGGPGGPSADMEEDTETAVTVEPIEPEQIQKPSKGKRSKVKRSEIETKAEKPEKKKLKGKKAAAKIKAALKKINQEIKDTKDMGLEVDEAESLIKGAIQELKANNLAKAKELGILSRDALKVTKSEFIKQKALDMIKVAWKEIAVAEEQGMDVSEANGYLQEARNQIKENKFEKAAQFAMRAINFFK
jgi:hypothetical protein